MSDCLPCMSPVGARTTLPAGFQGPFPSAATNTQCTSGRPTHPQKPAQYTDAPCTRQRGGSSVLALCKPAGRCPTPLEHLDRCEEAMGPTPLTHTIHSRHGHGRGRLAAFGSEANKELTWPWRDEDTPGVHGPNFVAGLLVVLKDGQVKALVPQILHLQDKQRHTSAKQSFC